MDINTARDTISGAIITKEKEIEALKLAQKVLEGDFAAEFTARDEAIKQLSEKETQLIEKDETISLKEQEIATLQSEKEALETQYDSLETEIGTKNETITTLNETVNTLIAENEELKKPVKDVPVEAMPE